MRIADYILNNLPRDQFPELSNDDIVREFKKDNCSFDQVLRRFHYLLVAKCKSKMPGMEPDDLYQELAVRLLHCCSIWNPNSGVKFSTYLSEACNNHIKWIYRKQFNTDTHRINYIPMLRLDTLSEYQDDETDDRVVEPSVPDDSGQKDIIIGIQLSRREEQCIDLIIKGYRNTEISDELGITRSMVSQVLRGVGNRINNNK